MLLPSGQSRRLWQHRRHPQQSLDRSPCGCRLVLSTEWASPLRSSAGGTPQHSLFVLETWRSSSGNLKGCGWWEGTGRRVVLQMCSAQHSSKHRLASLSVGWCLPVSWESGGVVTSQVSWFGGLNGDFKCPFVHNGYFWILCTHKLIPWMAAL